jgi:arabinan endo-1,5-alpha-L-arabinosidase
MWRDQQPTGPFIKYEGNPLLKENGEFNAPGHNDIIQDDAGQDWMLYHAYDRDNPEKGKVLLLDKIQSENGRR